MPVARIYTRVPEESTALVQRLRARGYTVELVDPADFRVTPADIEIRLDRMGTAEAFAAAAGFGREHDADVFVDEGVSANEAAMRAARSGQPVRGNIVVDGLKRMIAPFRRAGKEVHISRAARRQGVLEREAAAEREQQQRAEAKAAARAERERQESAARVEREQREREALAREQEEEARLQAEEARRTAEREALIAREREEDARRQEEEAQRRAERAAALAREREEAARMEAEAEQRRQHAEAAAALMAATAAAEQERLHERAAPAEVLAPVASVESVQPVEPVQKQRPARSREVVAVPEPRPTVVRHAPREHESSRAMKRAFVAAACIAILAAVGWGAYENRMPASPLSNADTVRGTAIHQDVPFGAARINAQGQTTNGAAQPVKPVVAKPVQAAQTKPAAAKPVAAKPSATSPKRTRRFAADSNVVAEDEVIYHGAPKKSSGRAATQQQAGVKKISDMN